MHPVFCTYIYSRGTAFHEECRQLHNLLLDKEVLQVRHLPHTCTNEDCNLDDGPLGGAVVDAFGCVSEGCFFESEKGLFSLDAIELLDEFVSP